MEVVHFKTRLTMKTYQVPPTRKPQRKPITHWEACIQTAFNQPLQAIDANNSIAILRAKYGNNVTYRAVR